MKTTRSYSTGSKESFIFKAAAVGVPLVMLTSCGTPPPSTSHPETPVPGTSTPEPFQTQTPDANKLEGLKQRAIDHIGGGDNAKFIGDQLGSFQVEIPQSNDGSIAPTKMAGTIFEVKSNISEEAPLTLGLYVPEDASQSPIPVVLTHLTEDPEMLGEGQVPEKDGSDVTVTRYGISALPLEDQYFAQIVNGGLPIEQGNFNQYLRKDTSGSVVPLYTLWFKDINRENIGSFMQELSQLKTPQEVQSRVIEHIYGATFNDFASGHSRTIRVEESDEDGRRQFVDFMKKTFFGETIVAHAMGASLPQEITNFDPDVKTGAVKGKDYKTGADSDWTVEATSVKATNYNDANFPTVVTGEATDASGNKFAVIWNEEGNYWFKSEKIDGNLESTNRTNFGDKLPGMVANRDLYRMLLTQMDTAFAGDTQTAQFWMMPRSASLPMKEFFYTLDMSRAGFSNDNVAQNNAQGVDLPDYQDIEFGGFAKGKEPYRALAMIDGVSPAWTDKQNNRINGKPISVIPILVQNSDGRSMIWFPGMDAEQREDILTGPDSVTKGYGIQNLLIKHLLRLNLVIPPADAADYDNYEKKGGNDGGIHFRGTVNFPDDAIIAMQDNPGVFFNLLPQSMQEQLNNALGEVKDGKGGLGWHAVSFDGALPQNVINYLSNHIFEMYFESNVWSK